MAKLQEAILRDTLANRPTAGKAGRVFYDTTNSQLQRDNGSSWDAIEGVGGATDHGALTGLADDDHPHYLREAEFTAVGDSLVGTGSGTLAKRKNNDAAAAAPAVGDDSGDGYAIGSRWLDTTNDKEYVALDVSVGAAVWVETTATGGGGSTTVDEYGTTAAGASWEAFTASRTLHKKITVANAGRLISVAAYVKGDATGVRSWGVALYDDNSNAPGKLIAAHVPQAATLFMSATGRWVEMPLAGTVTATAYWIALLMQADTNISIGYDAGGSDPRSSNSGQWFSDGLGMTDTTRNYSMHAAVLRT